jgi:long-subunit fatty acid transport protein
MHLWHAHEVQGALSTIDMTSIMGEISPHLCSNSAGSETMHLSKEMTMNDDNKELEWHGWSWGWDMATVYQATQSKIILRWSCKLLTEAKALFNGFSLEMGLAGLHREVGDMHSMHAHLTPDLDPSLMSHGKAGFVQLL